MKSVADLAELEALYVAPVAASLTKVRTSVSPAYEAWIMASRLTCAR